MQHFLDLPESEYSNIKSPLLTPDKTTYSEGDSLVVSMQSHREQMTLQISSVNRERIFKGWCYLGLKGIDDVKDAGI